MVNSVVTEALKRAVVPAGAAVVLLLLATAVAMAQETAPAIDISFEPGGTPGEQILHVETDFGVVGSAACKVLCVYPDYAALHPWIKESRVEAVEADGTQIVYFVLDLPWPVGRQWSRLSVERFGDRTMAWSQVEGSFRKNHGTVLLNPEGGRTHLSYWAVIDVGVPPVLARPFQEQFVREFLQAVYDAARRGTY
ncbi:MAG: hypothetical protein PVF51_05310 [Nitrospirota bacterium]